MKTITVSKFILLFFSLSVSLISSFAFSEEVTVRIGNRTLVCTDGGQPKKRRGCECVNIGAGLYGYVRLVIQAFEYHENVTKTLIRTVSENYTDVKHEEMRKTCDLLMKDNRGLCNSL